MVLCQFSRLQQRNAGLRLLKISNTCTLVSLLPSSASMPLQFTHVEFPSGTDLKVTLAGVDGVVSICRFETIVAYGIILWKCAA